MHGSRLKLPRKSMEPMVLALESAHRNTVRAMQQFIHEEGWADDAILQRYWQEINRALGNDEGVLTLDGGDFPKQGPESVGANWLYDGELGKRASCRASVFLGYVSPQGYT
jgi:SRSO17 transposase